MADFTDHLLMSRAHQNPRKCGGHSLDLSTLSLSSKTCAVLGKLFACSTALTEIRFNDCALQDDGQLCLAAFGENSVEVTFINWLT